MPVTTPAGLELKVPPTGVPIRLMAPAVLQICAAIPEMEAVGSCVTVRTTELLYVQTPEVPETVTVKVLVPSDMEG